MNCTEVKKNQQNQCDTIYLDLYERLNKLCNHLVKSRDGVSGYLKWMRKEPRGELMVYFWDDDYDTLRHLRWIHYRITHRIGRGVISGEDNLVCLLEFYFRMIIGRDPYGVLKSLLDSIDSHRSEELTPEDSEYFVLTPQPKAFGHNEAMGVMALLLQFAQWLLFWWWYH